MTKWLIVAVASVVASGAAFAQDPPGAAEFRACQEAAKKNDWATVITSCEKAVAANPDVFASHYMLGWAYLQTKKWDKCAEHYQKFLQKLGNEEAPQQREISNRQGGLCYWQAGQHAKAIPFLQKAAQSKPNDHTVQNALGLSYMRSNRENDAEQAFGKVIQLKPDNANPYYYAGNINFRQQDLAKAEQRLTKYLELQPAGQFAPDAHFMVGSIIYRNAEQAENKAEHFGVVKDHLGKFLEAKPNAPQAPQALYILGYIAAQEEDNETAKSHFEKFLQLQPTGPQAEEAKRFLAELSAEGA